MNFDTNFQTIAVSIIISNIVALFIIDRIKANLDIVFNQLCINILEYVPLPPNFNREKQLRFGYIAAVCFIFTSVGLNLDISLAASIAIAILTPPIAILFLSLLIVIFQGIKGYFYDWYIITKYAISFLKGNFKRMGPIYFYHFIVELSFYIAAFVLPFMALKVFFDKLFN